MLAGGASIADIRACIEYAAAQIDHPVFISAG